LLEIHPNDRCVAEFQLPESGIGYTERARANPDVGTWTWRSLDAEERKALVGAYGHTWKVRWLANF